MAGLPLPSVNPGGAVSPMSMDNLPQFAATGNAMAASPVPTPTGPDPTLSGAGNLAHNVGQFLSGSTPTQLASEVARQANPGVVGAISNYLFNPVGGPEAANYHAQVGAAQTLATPKAQKYMSDYPSLIDHATSDPVGFAKQLGPILEAHAEEQAGTHLPGTVPTNTADGPQDIPTPNLKKTTAISNALNIPLDRAHMMANPGAYSTEDYINGMRGISRGALHSMWEMQHYLNPQQQAEASYLTRAANGTAQPGYLDQVLRLVALGQNVGMAPNPPAPAAAPAK